MENYIEKKILLDSAENSMIIFNSFLINHGRTL
jgi:hypothetical protein